MMQEKNLIIVFQSIYSNSFKKKINGSEVLALTPKSMLSLRSFGIPFNVIEDFINIDNYQKNSEKFINDTQNIFNELDDYCNDFYHFPFSYSGNSHYFFYTLLDLLFIDTLFKELHKKYSKITIYGDCNLKKLKWSELDFNSLKSSPNGESISINLSAGILNKIRLMIEVYDLKIISGIVEEESKIPIKFKFRFFIQKLRFKIFQIINYCKKVFNGYNIEFNYESLFPFSKNKSTNKKKIFIIQDGYEVIELKKYLEKYELVYPAKNIRKQVPKFKIESFDFNKVEEVLNPFLKKNFSNLSKYIIAFFRSYHREVVGRIPKYIELINDIVKKQSPSLFLCSIGTRDIVDCIFNQIANKLNIPIVYFQHGGSLIYFNDPFQKFVGADYKIKKTLIIGSEKEKQYLQNTNSNLKVYGSIKIFNFLKNNIRKKHRAKAIYCTGPFTYQNYRTLISAPTDKEYYETTKSILNGAINSKLRMDIKVHPIDFANQLDFMIKLIQLKNYNQGTVLGQTPAEILLKKYGLIIIDFLGSALVPYVLGLKVPVILYLNKKSLINEASFNDLKNRCYIIDNLSDLEYIMSEFVQNKLDDKWFEGIIHKYSFPNSKVNPGVAISNYISTIV